MGVSFSQIFSPNRGFAQYSTTSEWSSMLGHVINPTIRIVRLSLKGGGSILRIVFSKTALKALLSIALSKDLTTVSVISGSSRETSINSTISFASSEANLDETFPALFSSFSTATQITQNRWSCFRISLTYFFAFFLSLASGRSWSSVNFDPCLTICPETRSKQLFAI